MSDYKTLSLAEVSVGDKLPPLDIDVTTGLVVGAALATRDYEPVHHDKGKAQAAGLPDVFMNILTSQALMTRFATDWSGPEAVVKSLDIRLGAPNVPGMVMTVTGEVAANQLGKMLPHEHVLVDFVGADRVSRDRYDAEEAFNVMLPFVRQAKDAGCSSIAECTPAYLGRDPQLIQRISQVAGVKFITNTGYYGARKGKFLPEHARRESADELHLPRRAHTLLALTEAHRALGDDDSARTAATEAVRLADEGGLRLVAIRARARLADLTGPATSEAHRQHARRLVQELSRELSPEQRTAFAARPFMRLL